MDPLVKQMLNRLRCPVCGSQIDLLDWKLPNTERRYNFCCAADWEHYRLFFIHWEPVLRIEYETVVLYEGHKQYWINQYEDGKAEIFLSKVDAENRLIDSPQTPIFVSNKKLFDFSHISREKMIHRIKTIIVFH